MPAANGPYTSAGKPKGYSALTPFIAVSDPAAALDFYESVFGARRRGVVAMAVDGATVVAHAELDFGDCVLQIGAANPAYKLRPPSDDDVVGYSLALYVPDVDAVAAAAVARGATLREPPADFASGDRFASLRDPFGVRWSLLTRVEDISFDESHRRVLAFFGLGPQ